MLEKDSTLWRVVEILDNHLATMYPDHFGPEPKHPIAKLKRFKVIHDNLWGTNSFSWRELVLIDSPIMQRLRNIHQTGLAYYVYPSARHSRFEHCLGVLVVASRAFDALTERQPEFFRDLASRLNPEHPEKVIPSLRAELRLAALLHDTGHSIHSHTSEIVYSELPLLQVAAKEISAIVGRRKGVGEVISFCLSQTRAVRSLLDRAAKKLNDENPVSEEIDLNKVSLLIVGRARHPYLQFLADIISSDFDADKLDYLLRDASAAGLPLRYDLERYLSTVRVEQGHIADDERYLEKLYGGLEAPVERKAPNARIEFEHYESYQLRLPKQAMSTIEQIVICKFMLYSYIYHHRKVRAAEGMLARALKRWVDGLRRKGADDEVLLRKFLGLTDASLYTTDFKDIEVKDYCAKISNRILPREVLSFIPNMFSHLAGEELKDFTARLLDSKRRDGAIQDFEQAYGEELLSRNAKLGANWREALWNAGAWLDVPSPPKFENVNLLVGASASRDEPVRLSSIFPIRYWIQAYEAHRYHIRIFAFSECFDDAIVAAKAAMKRILKITDSSIL